MAEPMFNVGDKVYIISDDVPRIYTITSRNLDQYLQWVYNIYSKKGDYTSQGFNVPQLDLTHAIIHKQNNTMVTTDFAYALKALKGGRKVYREGWNGKGMWLAYVKENEALSHVGDSWDHAPWIGMKTADGKFVPWLASQTDMLATDWCIMGEEKEEKKDDRIPVPENIKFFTNGDLFFLISPNGKIGVRSIKGLPRLLPAYEWPQENYTGKAFLVPCKRSDMKPGDIGFYSYGYDLNLEIEKVGHYCVILDETDHARWDREMDMLLCHNSMKNTWYKVIFK
jgi:hypothetical protein